MFKAKYLDLNISRETGTLYGFRRECNLTRPPRAMITLPRELALFVRKFSGHVFLWQVSHWRPARYSSGVFCVDVCVPVVTLHQTCVSCTTWTGQPRQGNLAEPSWPCPPPPLTAGIRHLSFLAWLTRQAPNWLWMPAPSTLHRTERGI